MINFSNKWIFALMLLVLVTDCDCNDDDGYTPPPVTQQDLIWVFASIHDTCLPGINYSDLNDNVYAYRADDFFFTPSIQAGGHSTADESTDLGVNIFGLTNGTYSISNGTSSSGSAYVFYTINNTEYISTANNTGTITVSNLLVDNQLFTVTKINVEFNQVEVANILDPTDIKCISGFTLNL